MIALLRNLADPDKLRVAFVGIVVGLAVLGCWAAYLKDRQDENLDELQDDLRRRNGDE